jgi:hypothetical protein
MLQKARFAKIGLVPVKTLPGADGESNWFPAPTGKFILMLQSRTKMIRRSSTVHGQFRRLRKTTGIAG